MLRQSCTVCDKTDFCNIYEQPNYPTCISSSSYPLESDIFQTLQFVGCRHCGCVQLKNLIDPSLLYSFSHNNTYETPTWKQHHELFSEFIITHTDQRNIVEVGGASGYLAELLTTKSNTFTITIIDLAKKPELKADIQYIEANCEDFDFNNVAPSTPIILSHVFEHLYRPRQFLENLKKAKIETIFLSIPNMELCLAKKFLSFLHVEHTYYCSTEHIIAMMAGAGFRCVLQENFKEHSIFFKFQRSQSVTIPSFPRPDMLLKEFQDYYSEREALYKSVHLEGPTYIVPAGHYGQLIYFLLYDQKDKILGFLDNDVSKVGKRMYGTDKYVYSMSTLHAQKNTQICILLNAGPYVEEIKTQMLGYNQSLCFLCV
jgi:2-polyprenyl-3-methyl-5-hydroxy-6-metoxy-1,4-benzoquinol methylase